MDYKLLNEKLRNLYNLRAGKPVETTRTPDESSWSEVYLLDGDIYIKFYISLDSYEDNETINGIEIVSPTKVTVTQFEPIK
jgi:hypothetical protein